MLIIVKTIPIIAIIVQTFFCFIGNEKMSSANGFWNFSCNREIGECIK